MTTRIVKQAQRTASDVVFRAGHGGHSPITWKPMFVEAVKWAFG